MKILIATDGSKHSKAAIEEIAKRTFSPDTEVRILSAYESTPLAMRTRLSMGGDSTYYAEWDAAEKEEAEKAVQEATDIFKKKNPDLSISSKVVNNSPKEAILKEAEKYGADKIVVGSQGKGALSRFLIGSVSQAVAVHAPCSVEIIRKKKK